MGIAHNDINEAINTMATLVNKGVPGAKKAKMRQLRAVILAMEERQQQRLTFKDVWFYFKRWLKRS
jgi:hypothetical protein